MSKKWLAPGILVVVAILAFWLWSRQRQSTANTQQVNPATSTSTPEASSPPDSLPTSAALVPIADFKSRITKKFFGTYVTPSNSPVQPERFSGYHTGVDVEYGDVTTDVPVLAIADGSVEVSKWATGYGGVILIRHQVNGQTLHVVYGHLRPGSLVASGSAVKQGEQIGVLGTAYSIETDGERRHLHFGVALSASILGYVSTLDKLHSGWIDPLSLYQ